METGGRSGISAIASISSGRGKSRTGRRQWLTQAMAIGSATGLIRFTERSAHLRRRVRRGRPAASVSIDVDQRRYIGDIVLNQGRGFLRFNNGSARTATRVSFSIPKPARSFRSGPETVSSARRYHGRLGGACANGLSGTVDLLDNQVGAAHPKAALLKLIDQPDDEAADIFVDRFGGANRFGEGFRDFDQLRRSDRLDRLGEATKHLVETAADLRSKRNVSGARGVLASSPMVWKPRMRRSLTILDGRRRSDIDSFSTARTVSPDGTMIVSRLMARAQAWAAPQLSATATRAVSFPAQKPVGDLCHHWQLAALQVVGAFGIHDNPIDPVDGNDWRIDRQRPERDAFRERPDRLRYPRQPSSGRETATAPLPRACRHTRLPSWQPGRQPKPIASNRFWRSSRLAVQAEWRDRLDECDPSADPEDKWIRPLSSHALTRNSAHSPAFTRINSRKPLRLPTPGTGSSSDGMTLTRHLVVDAVGWPKSFAPSAAAIVGPRAPWSRFARPPAAGGGN